MLNTQIKFMESMNEIFNVVVTIANYGPQTTQTPRNIDILTISILNLKIKFHHHDDDGDLYYCLTNIFRYYSVVVYVYVYVVG